MQQALFVTEAHPYELFTDNPGMDLVSGKKNNYTEIESDLQRKIDISSGIDCICREKSNRNLTVCTTTDSNCNLGTYDFFRQGSEHCRLDRNPMDSYMSINLQGKEKSYAQRSYS